MSDGARLHELWNSALSEAATTLKGLIGSSGWVRVNTSNNPNNVSLHKKGNVLRALVEIEDEKYPGIDDWRAVFGSVELRKEWDLMVDKARVLEMLDPNTRVVKTDYALGWPANPRDAITISRTVYDTSTVVDVSTSLPRSSDEPAYLRPSPPYVRSHVHLQAWCIQLPTPTSAKTRITLFWQHDLRNAFTLSSSSPNTALPTLLPAIYSVASQGAPRAPLVQRWGPRSVIDAVSYDTGRAALRVDYTILPDDEHGDSGLVAGQREVEIWISPSHAWEAQISTRAASEAVSSLPWTVNAAKSGSSDEADERTVMRVTHSPVPSNSASSLKVKLVIELGGGSKGTLRINGAPHSVSAARLAPRPMIESGFAPSVGTEILSVLGPGAGSAEKGTGSAKSTPAPSVQSRAASIASTIPSVSAPSTRTAAAQKSIQTLIRRSYTYFTALLQEPDAKWRPLLESRGVTVTQLDSIDPTLVVFRAEATFVGVGLWDILGVLGCEPARGVWEKGVEDVKLVEDVGELSELWRVGWKAAWPVNPRDTILLKTSYKSSTAAHVFSFSTTDTTLFPLIPPPELPTIRTHIDLHGFAIEALSPTTTLLTLLEQSSPSSSTPWTGRGSGGVPASMVATLAGIGEMVIKGGGAPPVVSRLSGARKGRVRYDHDRGMWRVEYERSERRAENEEKKLDKNASQSTSGAESDEEGGEMGASVATLIPSSGSKRGSSLSSSPDSMAGRSSAPSRTSLALSISPEKGIVFPTSESANNSSSTINGPINPSNPAFNAQPVELELRVDPDSWSPLELVIDPPPSTVRALKRHRLARGGGGLWITVEHAPSQLSSAYGSAINGINYGGLGGWDDRISVTVRKSAPASSSPKESPTTPVSSRDRDAGSEWEDASSGGEGLKTPIRTARDELLKFQGERARVDSTTRSIKSERPTHERSNSLATAPRISTARVPTLIVNGARVKVEVEELPEAEIKALAKAKRVKPRRIPLDEPPVMWKKRGRTNTTEEDSANGVGEGVGTDTEEAEASAGTGVVKSVVNWGMGMGSLGIGMGGLGRMWAPAGANVGVGNPGATEEPTSVLGITAPDVQSGVETAITSVAQPSTLLRLVTNTGTPISSAPVSSIPAGERPPMASALDALAFLTRQHTNNPTPDSIPTAGGWTAVSTKAGLTVTRRTEPAFSTSLPVHRCSKVLQGVSAEDVAGAISCSESRTQWDTWFDGGASVVLEEYGGGARTEFSVLKGGFPFRDRGFYVSTLTARAASGPGTPGLIFLTSASYNDATQHFAPGKVNVYSLPVGQMPLYGWVIETLDPYTAENYAIPSARCTLYVCVDYGGQVPVAYNAMVNSTLPRASITAVEAFLGAGSRASIPIVRYPSSIMAVKGVTEDEAYQKKGRELVWTIGHEDTRRSYLGSSYNQSTNVFQANIKMNPHTFRPPPSPIQPPMSAIEPSSTSSLLTVSSRSRKVSTNGGGNGASGGTSTSLGRSSGSRFRSRARTLSSNARPPDVNAEGLTVAEFVLDTRLFPAGYDVTTASMFLPEGSAPPVPFIMPDGSPATTTRVLPLRVQVYTVPLSPLRASATTTTQSTRQLIRITLPSTPHATPDVLDPLTGETRRGVEEPEWIKRLVTEQAIVRVTIGPSAIKDKIRVDGTITEVLSEKKSIVALGRAVLEEEHVGYSLLSRTKSGGGSSVPDSLALPVAAATHLYSDEPTIKSTPVPAMAQIVEEPAPIEPASTEDVSTLTPKYPSRPTQSRRPSASLFGFLSAYTNPVAKMPSITDDKREAIPPVEPAAPSPSTPGPAPSPAEPVQSNQKIMFEQRHSNATLIIVAIIAFLVGSLLRSLISPADFIYMGAPKSPNEHLDAENWRQVKRLVEIKYGWWGWDFVVAVVRRP